MDLKIILIVATVVVLLLSAGGWLAWRWSKREVRIILKRVAKLPLRSKFELAWLLFRDERIPLATRAILPLLFIYLAMPIDLIPDFIPVLGQIDDVLIAVAAMTLLVRSAPRDLLDEHLTRLEQQVANESPDIIELPTSDYRQKT
jgi:uncharacterized membrane protein YkvA (DUF1232 family)